MEFAPLWFHSSVSGTLPAYIAAQAALVLVLSLGSGKRGPYTRRAPQVELGMAVGLGHA